MPRVIVRRELLDASRGLLPPAAAYRFEVDVALISIDVWDSVITRCEGRAPLNVSPSCFGSCCAGNY